MNQREEFLLGLYLICSVMFPVWWGLSDRFPHPPAAFIEFSVLTFLLWVGATVRLAFWA